jgi:hypothetical protein
MQSRADENLDQTFENLFQVIRSDSFLARRGVGNEDPFFISAFHPSLQPKVDILAPALATRLNNNGVHALLLSLYDLSVELFQRRGKWEQHLASEVAATREKFLATMRNVTDAENHMAPLIASKLGASSCKVLLLTGVGLVYPYLRSHTILDNLKKVTKQIPTVLFFPGDYSFVEGKGSHLKLFGILHDDRYYRAFNIADFQP